MLGSTKFRAGLPELLQYDEHPAMRQDQALRNRVLQISKAQLDRLLRPYRFDSVRGISATRAGKKRIKNQIPIQAKDWNITAPGQQLHADTVAHCGDSLSGHFANSLPLTDVYSDWTANRPLCGKNSARVIEAMKDVEKSLPFEMKGFKGDSGNEFMNSELTAYRNRKSQPNPFELQNNLQKNLREFEEELRQRNTGQIAA